MFLRKRGLPRAYSFPTPMGQPPPHVTRRGGRRHPDTQPTPASRSGPSSGRRQRWRMRPRTNSELALYVPSHFAEQRPEVLHPFMRAHPFALLVTLGAEGPEADSVPFILDVSQ